MRWFNVPTQPHPTPNCSWDKDPPYWNRRFLKQDPPHFSTLQILYLYIHIYICIHTHTHTNTISLSLSHTHMRINTDAHTDAHAQRRFGIPHGATTPARSLSLTSINGKPASSINGKPGPSYVYFDTPSVTHERSIFLMDVTRLQRRSCVSDEWVMSLINKTCRKKSESCLNLSHYVGMSGLLWHSLFKPFKSKPTILNLRVIA